MKDLPAFPVSEAIVANEPKYQGMTLRDYFAIHAPYEEIIKMWSQVGFSPNLNVQQLRYAYADAMIFEREKGQSNG